MNFNNRFLNVKDEINLLFIEKNKIEFSSKKVRWTNAHNHC